MTGYIARTAEIIDTSSVQKGTYEIYRYIFASEDVLEPINV